MPLASQKRVEGGLPIRSQSVVIGRVAWRRLASQSVAIGRNRSADSVAIGRDSVAIGRDWSQSVVIGRVAWRRLASQSVS